MYFIYTFGNRMLTLNKNPSNTFYGGPRNLRNEISCPEMDGRFRFADKADIKQSIIKTASEIIFL